MDHGSAGLRRVTERRELILSSAILAPWDQLHGITEVVTPATSIHHASTASGSSSDPSHRYSPLLCNIKVKIKHLPVKKDASYFLLNVRSLITSMRRQAPQPAY
jgi:hypothetical protein